MEFDVDANNWLLLLRGEAVRLIFSSHIILPNCRKLAYLQNQITVCLMEGMCGML